MASLDRTSGEVTRFKKRFNITLRAWEAAKARHPWGMPGYPSQVDWLLNRPLLYLYRKNLRIVCNFPVNIQKTAISGLGRANAGRSITSSLLLPRQRLGALVFSR